MGKLKRKNASRVILGFGGAVIFLGALGLALYLLLTAKLSGSEFVAFVIAFAIAGAIIGFAPEVQEFSLAGNVVKLREIKQDVIDAVEGLKDARTELLRSNLRKIATLPRQHIAVAELKDRNVEFWAVANMASKFGVLHALKPELLICIEHLHLYEKHFFSGLQEEWARIDNLISLNALQYAFALNIPEMREFQKNQMVDTQFDLCVQRIFEEMTRLEELKRTLIALSSHSG